MVLPQIRFDMSLTSRAEIGTFRRFLYALSGRWKPIWIPSMAQDVQITGSTTSTTLDVAWMGFNDWPIRANRRDLRIELINGTILYRRITAAVDLNPTTERLQITPALPGGFSAANVASCSFMALCCQDADTNLLRLWSRDMVESNLAFRGINNDF